MGTEAKVGGSLALRLHHTGYRVLNFVEGLHFTKKPY